MKYAPEVPNAIYEFQGGAFDGWGGSGYDTCETLLGPEFEVRKPSLYTALCGPVTDDCSFVAGVLQERILDVHVDFQSVHDLGWHELGRHRAPRCLHQLRLCLY